MCDDRRGGHRVAPTLRETVHGEVNVKLTQTLPGFPPTLDPPRELRVLGVARCAFVVVGPPRRHLGDEPERRASRAPRRARTRDAVPGTPDLVPHAERRGGLRAPAEVIGRRRSLPRGCLDFFGIRRRLTSRTFSPWRPARPPGCPAAVATRAGTKPEPARTARRPGSGPSRSACARTRARALARALSLFGFPFRGQPVRRERRPCAPG